MNTIFKIMIFGIMLNISIGVLMEVLPVFDEIDAIRGGLFYQTNYTGVFTGELQDEINPSGRLEDAGNAIYRVLDMLSLGFIHRFISTITRYAYGFVNMLERIFGPILLSGDGQGLYNILFGRGLGEGFGILYLLMTIGYIYGAWYLWTGRDLRT